MPSECLPIAFACQEGTTLCHSGIDAPSPWLEIDLGDAVPLSALALFNRVDCCEERLGSFELHHSLAPWEDAQVELPRLGLPSFELPLFECRLDCHSVNCPWKYH